MVDSVTKCLKANLCKLSKGFSCAVTQPTIILHLQCQRQVPVIQSHKWSHPLGDQTINQTVVKINPFLIHNTFTIWDDTCPTDRKAIAACTEIRNQIDILFVAMVMITSDCRSISVGNLPWSVRVRIPDVETFAAL